MKCVQHTTWLQSSRQLLISSGRIFGVMPGGPSKLRESEHWSQWREIHHQKDCQETREEGQFLAKVSTLGNGKYPLECTCPIFTFFGLRKYCPGHLIGRMIVENKFIFKSSQKLGMTYRTTTELDSKIVGLLMLRQGKC